MISNYILAVTKRWDIIVTIPVATPPEINIYTSKSFLAIPTRSVNLIDVLPVWGYSLKYPDYGMAMDKNSSFQTIERLCSFAFKDEL